jgi:hypothetical protein
MEELGDLTNFGLELIDYKSKQIWPKLNQTVVTVVRLYRSPKEKSYQTEIDI